MGAAGRDVQSPSAHEPAGPQEVMGVPLTAGDRASTAASSCRSRPPSALRRRTADLRLLEAAGRALSSSLELHVALERAISVLLEARRYRAAHVLLVDWATHEAELYAGRRVGDRLATVCRRQDLVALAPQPRGVGTPAILPAADVPRAQQRERLLTSPIRSDGRTIGLLVVCVPASRRVQQRERYLLNRMSERVAAAVANARLYDRARDAADRLAALNAVGSAVRKSLRVPRLLNDALRQLLTVTNLEFAAVYLRSDVEGALSLAARSGITRRLALRLAAHIRDTGGAPTWDADLPSCPVIAEDLPETLDGRRSRGRTPRCLMYIPLSAQERALGLLAVGSYSQWHFGPGAAELLAGMAGQVSLALENAHLYEETKANAQQLAAANAELAEINEALREAARSKDQFLANVTHELKRPLAPARLVVETLLEAAPDRLSPQRQERLLRNALSNLDNMNGLVSDLLEAVRLQRRGRRFTVEPVDLRTVARRSLAAMRPLAEARRLKVQAIIPSGPVRVQGDAEALMRVLGNLLSNAVKFNRDGGSILVQLESSTREEAILSVTDTGIGIPDHARAHIFEYFYQADSSSTRAHEGLGLGLFIAKGIVEEHGGQIRFDTQEGAGTTFTVSLPLA
jgi:signal transduction histidine kinase